MNQSPENEQEWMDLFDAFVDERLSPSDGERLAQLLRDDPAAVDFFAEYMALHGRLEFLHVPAETEAPVSLDAAERSRRSSSSALGVFVTRAADFVARPTPFSLAVAATMVSFTLGVLALIYLPRSTAPTTETPLVESPKVQAAEDVVAQITNVRDAQGKTPLSTGAAFTAGDRLSLERGLVEISFRDGSIALLRGPATIYFESYRSAVVKTGRLHVRAKRDFFLVTPVGTVVDVGTEFGLEVAASGDTRAYVYQGAVKIRPRSRDGRRHDWRRVAAGESVLVAAATTDVVDAPFPTMNDDWEMVKSTRQRVVFNKPTNDDGPPLQVDFDAYKNRSSRRSETQSGYRSMTQFDVGGKTLPSDLGIGGNVTVSLSRLASPTPDRVRSPLVGGPGAAQSDLLHDFVFAETPGALDVRLGDLRQGEYVFHGYFHDSFARHGSALVSVSVDGGKTFRSAITVPYSEGTSPPTVGQGRFTFRAARDEEVVVRVKATEGKTHVLNGFQLFSASSDDAAR